MTPDQDNDTPTGRAEQVAGYLDGARWFGGKGRPFEVTEVTVLELAPGVTTNLVGLRFTDGEEPVTDLYQLPLASYDQPQERLGHALVGTWEEQHHYDAVHDKDAMAVWLSSFGERAPGADPALAFTRVSDHELDTEAHSTLFSGEQSNSSLAFGEDSLLKVFRRVHPGVNPDIEIHEVLTRAGNTHVAALHGHVVATLPGVDAEDRYELAMLQQFLRTASDGWDLALGSARNLVMETDLLPEEAGGTFAGEAHRLGANLAEIHQVLAESFGTTPYDADATGRAMAERLSRATSAVPDLAPASAGLSSTFAALGALSDAGLHAQRVHGDLHLGQTLRTSLGWKFVDFEGEPAKPLAERRLPDSPWRDVAGMIRSFDYAASTVARDLGGSEEEASEIAHRSDDWTAHTTAAFLAGYTEQRGAPMSDTEAVLLRAYTADKAVYEVLYEARNRPGWIGIPLAALAGIAGVPA